MDNPNIPSKQGQIVKLTNPLPDENPAETYLILEDLDNYSDNAIIYVVSITDLQRNIANPSLSPRKAVTKSELTLVAQDLTNYIQSFNRP
jgi:hypothetical protein